MHKQAGMTMAELLVIVAIMGLGLGIASLMLRPLETPLESGATLLEGLFRQARLEAIAKTAAYRVAPDNPHVIGGDYAASCTAADDEWTADNAVKVQLPEGVTVSSEVWSVCFSSRGISNTNQIIELQHSYYGNVKVEVLLGGTTRVLQ